MKHIKLLGFVAVLVPCLSQAAVNAITKNYGTGALAATTNPIIINGALATPGTGTVAVGIFGSTDAQISAVGDSPVAWAAVAATFQQFGASAPIGTGAGAAPGFAGLFQITPGANVAGTTYSGKNVYVAIGNGASLATSTFYAVFKSTTTFADEPIPSVNAWLTDTAVGADPAGTLLLGSWLPGQVWYPTGIFAGLSLTGLDTAGVPEPTTALLGLLSLGFGLVRRRR